MSEPTRTKVTVPGGSYDVVTGQGILGQVGDLVREAAPARRLAVISDSNVSDRFGVLVESKLITAGYEVYPLTFQAGEASKRVRSLGERSRLAARAATWRPSRVFWNQIHGPSAPG